VKFADEIASDDCGAQQRKWRHARRNMADAGQRKQYDDHGSSYVGEYFVYLFIISPSMRECRWDVARCRSFTHCRNREPTILIFDMSQLCVSDRTAVCPCFLVAWHFARVAFFPNSRIPSALPRARRIFIWAHERSTPMRKFANRRDERQNEKEDERERERETERKEKGVTSREFLRRKTRHVWITRLHRLCLN